MTYDKAELVALDKKYVWHHLTQHKNFEPAIYVKGEGMRITDIDGKTYLDAVSGGVWTVNVGYGRKEIVDAVANAMVGAAKQAGVLIGKTSRSFREFNNTLTLCPALIATEADIDEIVAGIDKAFTTVEQKFGL